MKNQNDISKEKLNEFAKQYSFHTQMSNGQGLDSYSNYGGPSLGDLVVIPGIGRNRDSEIMDESNFEAALEMLGGESKTVEVHRMGHWACGWFEIITVDPKDRKALKIAFEIQQSLKEYPVLDESDYHERETEYQTDFAEDNKEDVAQVLTNILGLPEEMASHPDMLSLAVELNIECQRYYGNDSCLFSSCNYMDRFDDRDADKYFDCISQLQYNSNNNELIEYALAVCGVE